MAHPRKLIRAAIVDALKAAGTAAGPRVFKSRSVPWRSVELPGISVWSAEELLEEGSEQSSPRELIRAADFTIDIFVAVPANGEVDDALDDIAEQVEAVFDADRYLGDTASDFFHISSTFGEVAEGNRPMGALRMVYRARYITELPATAGALDFQKAGVTYDLNASQHPDDQAQDLVTGLDQ